MFHIGICKYCGQEKELINSHIIPKCFYQLKTLGRMLTVDVKRQKIDVTKHQNGHKEPLLCAECDNRLGQLDEYAYGILFNTIPQQDFKISDDLLKKGTLHSPDFNYYKLRRFFISLVWRASICESHPPSLGIYEKIALKILKNEVVDNNTLFLPLIYRKNTGKLVDYITGVISNDFLGRHNYNFRFPYYEIMVITDTNNPNHRDTINILKEMFTKDKITIIELPAKTNIDYKLIKGMLDLKEQINAVRPKHT